MTQELNKEGLEAAAEALREVYDIYLPSMHLRFAEQLATAAITAWEAHKDSHPKVTKWVCEDHPDKPWGGNSDSPDACHCGGAGAIRSHLKVTGFEGRIAEWRKAVINGGTISTMIRDADKIIKDLQAALAGGGHEAK